MIREEIIAELDALIVEGNSVIDSYIFPRARHTPESVFPETRLMAFRTGAVAIVSRIAGRDSEYYQHLPALLTGAQGHLRIYKEIMEPTQGVLIALQAAVTRGLLVQLEQRVRSNTYDDFLEQAKELLHAKPAYAAAAMVLVGGVLEDHLRKICAARGVAVTGSPSIRAYNDALKEVAYPQTTWRRCQVVGDNRNAAAHGGDAAARLKADAVEDDLRWVQKTLAEYPS